MTQKPPKPTGRRKMISTQLAAFTGEGQSIVGRLTEMTRQNIRGNECGRYVLVNETGTIIVNGTTQLDEAFPNAKVGDLIEITYKGTAHTGAGWDVKLFEVYILEEEEGDA